MATPSAQIPVKIVDSIPALQGLIDSLESLPINPPSIYIDLEGIKLGRYGSISILSLFIKPSRTVYLVDIHLLGSTAFSTPNSKGTSLKAILESPTVPKVIFDVRNDSDALFSHYQISVNGIKDLQLMELATRQGPKAFVSGLARCIDRDSSMSAMAKMEWQSLKESTTKLFAPEKGGNYEVFNERPLRPEIIQYSAQDVTFLPVLYDCYTTRLGRPGQAIWRLRVEQATADRVSESQSPGYDPQGREKARGPWPVEQQPYRGRGRFLR